MPHTAPARASPLTWDIEVPILTHPLVLIGIAKVFGFAGLSVWGIAAFVLAVQGDWGLIRQVGLFVAAIAAGIVAIGVPAAALVYRNRIGYRFTLDGAAVTVETIDRRVRLANRLLIVAGILAGRPGAVGTGLIGEAETTARAAWSSVVRVTPHPRWHAISLANGWRTTMILHCRPETYETVLARVRAAHAAHPAKVRPRPLRGLLLATVVVAAAAIPLFHLPGAEASMVPLFALCFALAAVWLIPVLAWVVIAMLAWLAVGVTLTALRPYTSQISHRTFGTWELWSGDDIAVLVLGGLGAGCLIAICWALLTGRLVSALAGDRGEMER